MKTNTRTESFALLLKRLREERGYTLRSLGKAATLPHSAIAAIESGRRSVSAEVATRLAEALTVQDKDAFILKAISTTKRQKLLSLARGYRAEVLNYLAACLAGAGILPSDIQACYFAKPPFDEASVESNFTGNISNKTKKGQIQQMSFRSGSAQPLTNTHLVLETGQGHRIAIVVTGSWA